VHLIPHVHDWGANGGQARTHDIKAVRSGSYRSTAWHVQAPKCSLVREQARLIGRIYWSEQGSVLARQPAPDCVSGGRDDKVLAGVG
jgi:hypothetical protein